MKVKWVIKKFYCHFFADKWCFYACLLLNRLKHSRFLSLVSQSTYIFVLFLFVSPFIIFLCNSISVSVFLLYYQYTFCSLSPRFTFGIIFVSLSLSFIIRKIFYSLSLCFRNHHVIFADSHLILRHTDDCCLGKFFQFYESLLKLFIRQTKFLLNEKLLIWTFENKIISIFIIIEANVIIK